MRDEGLLTVAEDRQEMPERRLTEDEIETRLKDGMKREETAQRRREAGGCLQMSRSIL